MDTLTTEQALLIEIRTTHILARSLSAEHWRELVKAARAQAEEELNLTPEDSSISCAPSATATRDDAM